MSVKSKKIKAKLYVAKNKDSEESVTKESPKKKLKEEKEYKKPMYKKINEALIIVYFGSIVAILLYFLLAFLEVVPLVFAELDLTLNIVTLFGLLCVFMLLSEGIESILKYRETKDIVIETKTDKISRSTTAISIIGLIGVIVYFFLTFYKVIPPIIPIELPDGLGKDILEALGSCLILLGLLVTIFWGIITSLVMLTPRKKSISVKRDQWLQIGIVFFSILAVVMWYLYLTGALDLFWENLL